MSNRRSTRREFLKTVGGGILGATGASGPVRTARAQSGAEQRPLNFVLIVTDDLGYGDLGCYGAGDLDTPHLDQLSAEGVRFTDFYAAAPICTPTRAALMTGCYPPRVGLPTPLHTPDEKGLNPDEITIAELLKSRGYRTACIGKWHLGHHPRFYPTRHGFDRYYGTPLGHCFETKQFKERGEYSDLFLDDETPVDFPPHEKLPEVFTREATRFIRDNRDGRFFLYLAYSMPHFPLAAPERFRGKSKRGLYGDVIEYVDWSVGRVVDTLKELGIERDTVVIFTSDNGPSKRHGGSSGPLRGGKHSAYEGGLRVPCIAWGPGTVPGERVCHEVATVMDFYPTFARLAGATPPEDRVVDGHDIWPLLTGQSGAESPYDRFYYHVRFGRLAGVREGRWKLLLPVKHIPGGYEREEVGLFDLESDRGETTSLAPKHPDRVKDLRRKARAFERRRKENSRPPG